MSPAATDPPATLGTLSEGVAKGPGLGCSVAYRLEKELGVGGMGIVHAGSIQSSSGASRSS